MLIPILTPVVLLYGKVLAFVLTAYHAIRKHLAVSAIKAEIAKLESVVSTDVKLVVARIKAHL
jgi:hypothetical protein